MQLAIQILVSYLLVILMTLIHAFGIILITKFLRLDAAALRAHRLDPGAFALLASMTLGIFALHTLEIGLFALFYLAVGAFHELEPALYFSTESYTTLGPGIALPVEWRLVGAVEGLAGFVLIGWSIAVFVSDTNKLLRERPAE